MYNRQNYGFMFNSSEQSRNQNNPYPLLSQDQFVQNILEEHASNQNILQASGMNKEIGQKKLDNLAKLQVSTPQNAQDLVNHFGVALQTFYPSGMAKYGIWRPVQDSIYDVTNPPDPKKEIKTIVAMFQAMKKFAVDNSLAELSDAVTQSEKWFKKNIVNKKKFIKWGTIGTSVIVGSIIIFVLFKNKKN